MVKLDSVIQSNPATVDPLKAAHILADLWVLNLGLGKMWVASLVVNPAFRIDYYCRPIDSSFEEDSKGCVLN